MALKEVMIAVKAPVKLIKAAIRKIPGNYIGQPYQVRGFYRNVTNRDQDYMQLSEAVFDICSGGYTDEGNANLYLQRVRSVKDEQASHGLDLGLKPSNLFDYDVVKEISGNQIFNKHGLRDHRFMIKGIVAYKDIPAYVR
ncbi:hypothetical protein [uncultured Chitinophaga sp.]|uniref:hypothetical protein n=1 Tax=uncultured Chitinophaga sp. TaxID=339340 RepID=UPI002628038D|nr:hypothetical protein [uncultured Chitinophaga sp.]